MGVNRVKKRDKDRIEVRKRWPDGSTFRRYYPNMTLARRVLARIEESIFTGRWKELKEELSGVKNRSGDLTVEEFSGIYLDDYCRHHNRRPDFKKQALVSINRILGNIKLKDFQWHHADEFVSQRSEEVAPATINRGLAVLKNMLNFAVKRGYLEAVSTANHTSAGRPPVSCSRRSINPFFCRKTSVLSICALRLWPLNKLLMLVRVIPSGELRKASSNVSATGSPIASPKM